MSRITALAAVFVAVLLVGSPITILGNMVPDAVGVASAADGTRRFQIGVVDMTVSTLNPNTYTMVAEGMIIFPLYSYLIQWDKNGEKVIGDLAKSWWVSPDGLTWEFELVDTAYFVEYNAGSGVLTKGPKVTSEDVKWSIETLAANTASRLNSIWPEGIIDNMWTDSPTHFGINITGPFVPMQDSLMTQPVMPKYYWQDKDFIKYENIPPIGSGPFFYKTSGLPTAGYAVLARNPYWHGEESFGWQLHVDEFVMCRYDDAGTCWEALKRNDIDAMMGVDPGVFVKDLPSQADLIGFHQANGFVYEFNLNQLTEENRKLFGGPLNKGSNSQLLLNHSIKKAISMAIDRDWLIDEALYGYGRYTTTLVPFQNPMSHNYGEDGHDCILDPGVTGPAEPDPVDRAAARNILWDAGWRYDAAGTYYEKTDLAFQSVYPLFNGTFSDPNREELTFNFYTLSTGDTWKFIGNQIVNWTREIGVNLEMELKRVNDMNSIWYSANYDVWLWDWVFTPFTEAASGVLEVLTTGSIGTSSDIYLSDPVFDALYEAAIREMDFDKRKEILYQMQDIAYLNRGCQALAFRDDLYAFNINRWENFGDLNNEYFLLPDVWPTWLCMEMNPVGNAPPLIGNVAVQNNTDSGLAEVGTPVTFRALGVDDDWQDKADLNYTWIWGFGGEKQCNVGDEISHVFTTDGLYTVTLVVKETAPANGHADYLSSYKSFDLVVHDMSNNAPHSLAIGMTPLDPTAGEVVTFTGSAVDDEDDTLYYTWDFGDGSVASGPEVTHQFEEEGSFTVTMYVDDHRYGQPDSRPVMKSRLVPVAQNHAPWVSVPSYGSVGVKQTNTYSVMAGDSDPRDVLKYTWDWGDGFMSVTDVPHADYMYNWKGDYLITVHVDDQTGLPGHNVSDSQMVYVVQSGNNIPVIAEFYVDQSSVFLGQTVTFHATAADGDGDPLEFTFDFDDGTTSVRSFGGTAPLELVECSVQKEYSSEGTYSVYLYVTDDVATATSHEVVVTVGSNAAPEILEFSPLPYYDTGVAMPFSVIAVDDDGDDLTYSWDWGDGTTSETTVGTTSHTFAASGTYTVRVVVDDGKGLGDMAESTVTVNWVPYISPPLSARTLNVDEEYTFTVSAFDQDSDALTYMWDFGDDTGFVMGQTVTHTYVEEGTFTRTVYVWDDFVQHRTTHNVSSSALVTVKDPSVDSPPDVDQIIDIYAVEGKELTLWVYASDDNDEDLVYWWEFGDGTTSDLEPPVTHTYVAHGEYDLVVWVRDQSGIPENNVSVGAKVYVAQDMPPVADAGGDRTVDEDVPITFSGAASTDEFPIPSDGYAWTVNDHDGAHSYDGIEIEHTFWEPGVYTVELVVTDSIGQESEPDVITVTVRDVTPPTVDAGPDQTVHVGSTVQFEGSASDDYDDELTFQWRFMYDDELTTMTGETPSFTFDIMAVYTVTLRVTDDAGNYATDDVIIRVTDLVPPVADAGEDQAVAAGDTVTFDGSGSYDADSTIVEYVWEFEYDDGTETLSGVDPTFVFDVAGVYVVTLTVEDEGGNTDSDTVTITVEGVADEPPVADAGSDVTINVGTLHTFDGTGSTDDGEIADYVWTFTYDGDLQTLTGAEPQFLFAIAGVYVVTLNVTDDGGQWDTDTVTVTVVTPNAAPVADAGPDQTVKVGDTVTFDGSGSSDSDGTIASYAWTFTYDGQTQSLSGEAPTFVFEEAGEYTVTLTVTDDDGATGTDTVRIVVEEEDEGGSFLGTYGLPIALVVVLLVVAVAVMFLLKARKGPSAPPPEQS